MSQNGWQIAFKKKISLIKFALASLVLVVVTMLGIKQNPGLLHGKTLSPSKPQLIWNCAHFQNEANAEQRGQVVSEAYRQGPSREAIFEVPHFHFDVRKAWMSPRKINIGIHGASKSSVLADAESIFIGSDSSWFYSFSKNGDLQWKNYFANSTRGIHSTAVTEGPYVYVGSYRGTVYKLDRKTGQPIWSRIVGHTIGASPMIVGRQLIIAVETMEPNGYLVSLDTQTCELLWQTELLGEQAHSSPVYDAALNYVILGVNNSTIQAFDASTGHKVWQTAAKGPIKSTGWKSESSTLMTSWGNDLFKIDNRSGEIQWRANLNGRSQVSPAFSKKYGVVLASDFTGKMFGVAEKDGAILWTIHEGMSGQKSSPILLVDKAGDERFLFYCAHATLCLIHPRGKIEKKWTVDGIYSGSLFLGQYDAKKKQIELPMSFDVGSLVMYHLYF